MADSPTSDATGTPASGPTWNDGTAPFAKLNLALQATALRDNLELAQINSRRTLESVHGLPRSPERPEDMIQVDSPTTVVNHHYPPAAAAAGPIAAASPPPVSKPAGLIGALAKIGVALAVSGPIGAGIAAFPYVASWATRPAAVSTPSPAPSTPANSDTGTVTEPVKAHSFTYELRLGK